MSKNRRKGITTIEHGYGYSTDVTVLVQQNCSIDMTRVIVKYKEDNKETIVLDENFSDDVWYLISDTILKNGHEPEKFTEEEHELFNNKSKIR